jgi:2,4-dienoyl-CoA reductase-like NADH-dependent reductase (Old Yellow Enzyme family)
MGKKLGLYVSSDEHMEKIIKLCQAAKKKDVEVTIFLTHVGTRLTQDPRLEELLGLANVSLCKVAFEAQKLEKPMADLDEKAYTSQSFHAEMILDCDQYLAF